MTKLYMENVTKTSTRDWKRLEKKIEERRIENKPKNDKTISVTRRMKKI